MNTSVRNLTLALLAAVAVLGAAQARGQTTSWKNSPSSAADWSTSASWTGGVPTSASTAYIANGGTANVTTAGDVCNTLYLGGGSPGTVNMTGGGLAVGSAEYVGNAANGYFTQNGGTNSLPGGVLYVGQNASVSGSYSLSSANGPSLLSAGNEIVGVSGIGQFTQNGGTNSVANDFVVADNTTSSGGTYSLQNGTFSGGYAEYIGFQGTGVFTQSGGTNTGSSNIYLGYEANSAGTYNLSGGLLRISNLALGGGGTSNFNFSGGTMQAATGATATVPINFSQTGSNGVFDTNGYGLNLAGELSGNGGLQKIGFGTLQLSNANYYAGQTLISAGTLNLSNQSALAGGGSITFAGGTLQYSTANTQDYSSRIVNSNGPIQIDTNGQNVTFAGGLAGSNYGGLIKYGAGMLTLSGVNTYLDGTTVSAGVLVADSGPSQSATGGGAVVLNGGTLAAGPAGGMIGGEVFAGAGPHVIAPGATLSVGNYGTLNLEGGLQTNSNTSLEFNMSSTLNDGLGTNGLLIYLGDLINMGASTLNASNSGSIGFWGNNPMTPGDYRLIAYTGAAPTGLNNLVLPSQPGETYTLSTTVDPNHVDLIASTVSGGSWNVNSSGSWGTGGNWSSGVAPSSGTVTFGGVPGFPGGPSSRLTVTLDGSRSAAALVFSANGNYTLAQSMSGASGSLTLGPGGSIAVVNGSPIISAPVLMNVNLAVNITGGVSTSLTLSGGLGEQYAGSTLTLNSNGWLILSSSGSYTGGTVVNSGFLVANNGATGSATGNGSVTLNSGANLCATPAGGTITGPVTAYSGAYIEPGQYDYFAYACTLNLTGSLTTYGGSTLMFKTGSQVASLNGTPVFGGDLINLGGSALNDYGGSITFYYPPTTAGDYRLFETTGSILNLSNFTLSPPAGWAYTLSSTVDTGYIDLIATATTVSGGTWTYAGNGSWTDGTKWSCNPTVPTSGTVTFPDVGATAPIVVNLDGPQTAGALLFNVSTTNGYTLAPGAGGSLTLGTGGGSSIQVLGGAHTISAPLVMAGEMDAFTAGGTSLTLSGGLSESTAGSVLSASGSGQVVLSGAGSYTGGTMLYGGMLVVASGMSQSATGTGSVTLNGGTLAAGPAGGTIGGQVIGGGGPHVIAPGAVLSPGNFGALNLFGGLTTSQYTTLAFNLNLSSTMGGSGNSLPIFYGGDLINLGNSVLDATLSGNITFGSNPTTAGDYRLFQYNTLYPPLNLNNLVLPYQSGETYTLSTTADTGFIDLVATANSVSSSGGTWIIPAGGSWSNSGCWSGQAVPNSGTATFPDWGPKTKAPITVTLDGFQQAWALVFDTSTANGYTLSPGTPSGTGQSMLMLDPPMGNASIAVVSGSHVIDVPVMVQIGSLEVTGSGTLDFGTSGSIKGSASLIMDGAGGTLTLSGSDYYGGGTYVEQGTLMANNNEAIEDATNLYVGSVPNPLFGGVVPAQADGARAVPEPGTLALLTAAVCGAAIYQRLRSRQKQQ